MLSEAKHDIVQSLPIPNDKSTEAMHDIAGSTHYLFDLMSAMTSCVPDFKLNHLGENVY